MVTVERELAALLGPDGVLGGDTREYLTDATESRGSSATPTRSPSRTTHSRSRASCAGATSTTCRSSRAAAAPGFAGGAVPLDGGVVLSLERLQTVRHLDPELWRAAVEAGWSTADAAPPRARERPALPARPRRRRAVPDRRQHRHQRRRPAHVQVRRHRRLGHRARGRARAGRARQRSAARSARTSPATTSSR